MKGTTLSEMIGSNSSPTAKLALLIERIVRKVIKEELRQLQEVKSQPAYNTPIQNRQPVKSKLPPAIAKAASANSVLREIFENTAPFGREDSPSYSEQDFDPTSLMAEGFNFNTREAIDYNVQHRSSPQPVVAVPAGVDEATKRIADIMNKTDYKAIVQRSKEFDKS